MLRVPRVGLVLVVAALVALLVVPMAGARTVGSPSVHPVGDNWTGVALRWVGDLIGLRHRGPSDPKAPTLKDGTNSSTQGGSCIDPMGIPPRWCVGPS